MDDEPRHLSVLDSLKDRHVLVTGVTGFLGKVWLAMLLDRVPTVGRVTVVIRSRRGETAQERFEHIAATSPALRPLREVHGGRILTWLRERVRVIEGDCSLPLCGLSEQQVGRDCADVDAVVHFAGVTDFMPDPKDALSANVRGAVHAADLAARTRGRRLVHTSTAFVAGRVRGEVPEHVTPGVAPDGTCFDPGRELDELVRIAERIDDKPRRTDAAHERAEALGWPNLYTYSKGLAEHLLASRDDVRLTLVRPSIVECARSYPFEGWNQGINTSGPLVWLFSTSFRHFPSRPHHHFDVVPVDTVARGTMLVAAAALGDRAEAVYQLGSSDTNPLTFGRAIDLTNLGVRRMHSRPDARELDRWLVRHLDVGAVDGGRVPLGSPASMRRMTERGRKWLARLDLEHTLPRTLWQRWGEQLETRRSAMWKRLRKTERELKRVEQMLELYRPFIHDHDYVFRTDRVRALSRTLASGERERFSFDVESLDWRRYWLEVEVPGLEKWSLPIMKGERVPDDPPPPDLLTTPEPPQPSRPAPSRGGAQPRLEHAQTTRGASS